MHSGHVWPATVKAWFQRIGLTNAHHIRNLDFDMGVMTPMKKLGYLRNTPDAELRLRLLRKAIATSLAGIARSVVQGGCTCTATITLRGRRKSGNRIEKFDLARLFNGELPTDFEGLCERVEDGRNLTIFLNDLQQA